ncbi:MAG: flagellar hook-length control protein FliK [bacterium]
MTARVFAPRPSLAPRSDVAAPRAAPTAPDAPPASGRILADAATLARASLPPLDALETAPSIRPPATSGPEGAPAREREARADGASAARPTSSPSSSSPASAPAPAARPVEATIVLPGNGDGPALAAPAPAASEESSGDEPAKASTPAAGKRTMVSGPDAAAPKATATPTALTAGAEPAPPSAPSSAPAASDASAASARTAEMVLRVVPGFEAQLAARARELLSRGQTEIRVTLDPPSLGRLRVRLLLTDTDAVAHISAGSPEAAALLHRERADLARAFEQQGFSRVEVHVDDGTGRRSGEDADRPVREASAPTEPEPVSPSASRRSSRVDLFV